MTTEAISGYLAKLPPERRDAIARVRDVINAKLPTGYQETLQYGMISWCVPESVLPAKEVYNKQPLAFASLGSKKSYMTLHLMHVYADPKERAWLEGAYKKAGKKLDMGAGCLRFGSLDALPLDVIGEVVSHVPVDKYVDGYRKMRDSRKTGNPTAKTAKTGNATAKTATTGNATAKTATTAKGPKGANAKPAANKPAANKLAANKPAANKPAANKPAASKSPKKSR